MKKFVLIIVGSATLLCLLLVLFFVYQKETKQVCVDDKCFLVEIANERSEWSRGLMYRKKLAENRGMLFIFDRSYPHSIYMKNTLVSLDIVWLDQDKKVVHLKSEAVPCEKESCESFVPLTDSLYVLEIPAGSIRRINLEIGDYVQF